MSWTSEDRWTCPDCLHTEVFTGHPGKFMRLLRKSVQEDHGRRHAAERRRGVWPPRRHAA